METKVKKLNLIVIPLIYTFTAQSTSFANEPISFRQLKKTSATARELIVKNSNYEWDVKSDFPGTDILNAGKHFLGAYNYNIGNRNNRILKLKSAGVQIKTLTSAAGALYGPVGSIVAGGINSIADIGFQAVEDKFESEASMKSKQLINIFLNHYEKENGTLEKLEGLSKADFYAAVIGNSPVFNESLNHVEDEDRAYLNTQLIKSLATDNALGEYKDAKEKGLLTMEIELNNEQIKKNITGISKIGQVFREFSKQLFFG